MNKYYNYILIIIINLIIITGDLMITGMALESGNFYETRIYGNNPLIYYSFYFISTSIIYLFEVKYTSHYYVSLIYAIFPFIAVIINLFTATKII